jgi:dTDP-4-amino-4,6-dideoxygalactose transaminase
MNIPFNKPYLPIASVIHIARGALAGTIAGNGRYTKDCHRFFEQRFGFKKALLSTSCTDALEMASILCDIAPGDEVIVPSFAYMSTANPFLLRLARVVFADCLPDVPNIDPDQIEQLITPKTRVITVVHYGGFACDMDRIIEIARKNNILVVEDAAHAIDSYFRGRPLGSIGHFGTFSFHETKNIISGEGGMLTVNDDQFLQRAEIIWEKGTNRAAFHRGEIDRYHWVDIGSSFLPSDTVAAFLYTQLVRFDRIQQNRKNLWWSYYQTLKPLEDKGFLKCPVIPEFATVNGNMFYITVEKTATRDRLLDHLIRKGIHAVIHYFPLHSSPFFREKHDGRPIPNTERFSETMIRLPFYNALRKNQIRYICRELESFFQG